MWLLCEAFGVCGGPGGKQNATPSGPLQLNDASRTKVYSYHVLKMLSRQKSTNSPGGPSSLGSSPSWKKLEYSSGSDAQEYLLS